MGSVGAGFSMSLDGFVAGPEDNVDRVFAWMFAGNTEVNVEIGDEVMDLQVSPESADHFEEISHNIGAIISGRRTFDVAGAWGGKHPLNVPIIVMTYNVPEEWANKPGSPFTFVSGSIENAVAIAQKIAGDKTVGLGSPDVTRQALKAGLVDEIGIDLVPVLLGEGIPLFKSLGIEPVELAVNSVVNAPGVTHISYRVVKK